MGTWGMKADALVATDVCLLGTKMIRARGEGLQLKRHCHEQSSKSFPSLGTHASHCAYYFLKRFWKFSFILHEL